MTFSSLRILVTAMGLCLLLPTLAAADAHEGAEKASPTKASPTKEWDAKAIGRQLDRLSAETSHIQNGLGRHIEGEDDNSPRRLVLHDVYRIHHRVISLRMGIDNGLGREQTEPVFRRLLSSVRDARQDAASFPEIEEVRKPIDASNKILKDLEGYWGLSE